MPEVRMERGTSSGEERKQMNSKKISALVDFGGVVYKKMSPTE